MISKCTLACMLDAVSYPMDCNQSITSLVCRTNLI